MSGIASLRLQFGDRQRLHRGRGFAEHRLAIGLLTVAAAILLSMVLPAAKAGAACTIPNQITNGQVADATVVMGNFNALKDCADAAVKPSGSPTAGNLATFSSSGTVTNGNVSGDCTTSGTLAVTCTKTNGTAFGAFATGTDAGQLTGTISPSRFNNGTNADSSHYLRGDGTWGTPSGGGGSSTNLLAEFVATGTESTVTLNSLSQSYGALQIVITGTSSAGASPNGDLKMYANGDATDSHYRNIVWNRFGSASVSYARITTLQTVNVPEANAPTVTRIWLYDYSRTTWKKSASADSQFQDASNFIRCFFDWYWKDTSAVTGLTFTLQNSTFTAATRIQVFGYGS